MSTWNEPKTDWQEGEIVNEADMNEIGANLAYLYQRPRAVGSLANNAQTDSETFVAMHSSLNLTVTVTSGTVLVGFSGFAVGVTGTSRVHLDVTVDDVHLTPDSGTYIFSTNTTWFVTLGFVRLISGLTPGQHEFKMVWRVLDDATEVRMHGNDRTQFWVMEI